MNFKAVLKKRMERDPKQTEQRTPDTDAADQKALASNGQMDAQKIEAAHQQADRDMEQDAEFTASSPNDDLDEGETARLGEDIPDII